MKTILITGGTGLIGKALQEKLASKGYSTTILTRKKSENSSTFYWNIDKGIIEKEAVQTADFIIHLAGAGIADKRWSKKRKKILINSRIDSTKLLFKKVKKLNPKLKGFIATSGVGYYGATTSEKIYVENDFAANDFLATICKLWEKESLKFQNKNIRTVIFRMGVVFSNKGGALKKISTPIKKGYGAIIGSGEQYMPWIHIDDLCNMFLEAIDNKKLKGIYNAVAPEHTTNKQLSYKIATILKKKIWLPPIPSFILKIILGRIAMILLKGSQVSSKKIMETGFQFKYVKLNKALKNLLN